MKKLKLTKGDTLIAKFTGVLMLSFVLDRIVLRRYGLSYNIIQEGFDLRKSLIDIGIFVSLILLMTIVLKILTTTDNTAND